jgi:hypothetical protein
MSNPNTIRTGLEGLRPTAAVRDIQRVFEKPMSGAIASAAAATTQAEKIIGVARRPCRLTACDLVTDLDVTATNASYATITVFKRTVTTPGTAVTMLTISTTSAGTDDVASWAAASLMAGLSSTAANSELDTGDIVTFSVAKAGAGVALGTAALYLDLEELSD